MNYPIKRTPEEGHTRACLAKAMIAAIENLRDLNKEMGEGGAYESSLDFDFRIAVQNNEALSNADYYLREGMTECICPN